MNLGDFSLEPVKELEKTIQSYKKAKEDLKKKRDIDIRVHKKFGKYISIDGVTIAIEHWNPEADLIYISHPHMDHIPKIPEKVKHKLFNGKMKIKFLCSQITKEIAKERTNGNFDFPDPSWLLGKDLKKINSIEFKGVKLKLLENGHTYGSTSLLLEGSERVFYTSDFTTENKQFGAERTPLKGLKPIGCKHLITECTYGSPQFIFPSFHKLKHELNEYVERNLEKGDPTIILAYSFGKSQNILNMLKKSFRIILDRRCAKNTAILQELGIEFNSWEPYGNYNKNILSKQNDYVLIIPPYSMFREPYKTIIKSGAKIVFASGKGLVQTGKEKVPADKYLLYSDHCDFGKLINFIENCQAKKIYLEHGLMKAINYFLTNFQFFKLDKLIIL